MKTIFFMLMLFVSVIFACGSGGGSGDVEKQCTVYESCDACPSNTTACEPLVGRDGVNCYVQTECY